MQVVCKCCAGTFDGELAKCPYCGYINETGAEKAYMEKMEGVRKDLDEVDDIVVSNFKQDLMKFLKAFGVSLGVIVVMALIVINGQAKNKEKERNEYAQKLEIQQFKFIKLDKASKRWNELYEAGDYAAMYETAHEVRQNYTEEFCQWKHYAFYASYESYAKATEYLQLVEDNGHYSKYEMSHVFYEMFNLYCDLNNKNLTYYGDDLEVLGGYYEEIKERAEIVFGIPEKEFEEIREKLAPKKTTYVGLSACEQVAAERVGE